AHLVLHSFPTRRSSDLILSVNIDDSITFSIIIIILALIIFVRPRHVKALFSIPRRDFLLPGMFLFVGVVYFIGIVYMRFTAYFRSEEHTSELQVTFRSR